MGPYASEKEMYPDVVRWLKALLQSRHKKAKVFVWDSSSTKLSRLIEKNGLAEFHPHYLSFDILVDVVGAVVFKNAADLYFVECKLKPVTLRDVGQMLGYCRVALPSDALLLSPSYVSEGLHYLLEVYERYEVLWYGENRNVRIARWNADKRDIEAPSIIPPGNHF